MPAPATIDEAFFDTAPVRYATTWDVAVPAAELWHDLTDRPLHWCRGVSVRWTSPRPFGVGTTRRVGVLGALRADEYYFLWEEGRRHAFHIARANLPLFKRFGEYYEVEPIGEHKCRFTWKIATELTALGRLNKPAVSLLVTSLFRDTTRYLGCRVVDPPALQLRQPAPARDTGHDSCHGHAGQGSR